MWGDETDVWYHHQQPFSLALSKRLHAPLQVCSPEGNYRCGIYAGGSDDSEQWCRIFSLNSRLKQRMCTFLNRSAVPMKRCLSAESHTDTGPLWNRSRGNLLHRDKRCVHLLNDWNTTWREQAEPQGHADDDSVSCVWTNNKHDVYSC